MGLLDAAGIWIYLVATPAGGGLAALTYNLVTTGKAVQSTEGSRRGATRPARGE